MIYFVKRNQINEKKYNDCISNSLQSRIYGYSWYLDVVSDNWSALVLNDYEAVFPLPIKSKFGISYIVQPFFTQQLGVFSKEKISDKLFAEFLNKIPSRFLKTTIQFNSENTFIETNSEKKNNYILPLDKDYEVLWKNFSKGRKHAIQQGLKNQLEINDISFTDLLLLSKEHYSFTEISDKEYNKFKKVVEVLKTKNKIKVLGVFLHKELIGGSVFVFDSQRIVYLFSAVSQLGKEKQAASLLLHKIIKENSNSDKILDFEGSQFPSIASFFKSFGAKIETYFLFKKRFL